MSERPTVVVTGLGAITPLGGDVASTWEGMLAGRSGITRLDDEWARDFPARLVARMSVEPTDTLERVEARRLDRCHLRGARPAVAGHLHRPAGRRPTDHHH